MQSCTVTTVLYITICSDTLHGHQTTCKKHVKGAFGASGPSGFSIRFSDRMTEVFELGRFTVNNNTNVNLKIDVLRFNNDQILSSSIRIAVQSGPPTSI